MMVNGKKKVFGYFFLFLLVLFLSDFVVGTTLTNGLVNYYKFDECSGTSVIDSVGNNNATLDSASMWNSTNTLFSGSCSIQVAGSTDNLNVGSRLSVPNATLSVWVLINGSTGANAIYNSDNLTSATHIYYTGANDFYVGIFRNDRYSAGAIGSADNRSWVLWTFVNVPGANGYKVYENNVSRYQNTGETSTYFTNGRFIPNSDTGSFKIQGIGYWNRALSSSEINELYQDGLNGLQYPFVNTFDALNVSSISPINKYYTNITTPLFTFNITDYSGTHVWNATLYVGGVNKGTNNTINSSGVYSITSSALSTNTEYEWYVSATDGFNTSITANRSLYIKADTNVSSSCLVYLGYAFYRPANCEDT